ncbi:unnamed protein product [Malus baccata var. baccata]
MVTLDDEYKYRFTNLSRERNKPWLCCGDFNKVLNNNEMQSVKLRSSLQIEDFRRAIRKVAANVKTRLDRGFGNLALIQH